MQRFCFDISDQQEFRFPARPHHRPVVDRVSRFERIELELLCASSIMDTDPATTKWERIELVAPPRRGPVGQRPALAMAGVVALLALALGSIVSIF